MKKTYIAPELQVVIMGCETVIASSMKVSGEKITSEQNGGWAKENSGSSNYDVWDDDWSKN